MSTNCDTMINRLPNEFRAQGGNGRHQAAVDTVRRSTELPQQFLEKAAQCIANHPLAALGAALAIGMLVGKWVKR